MVIYCVVIFEMLHTKGPLEARYGKELGGVFKFVPLALVLETGAIENKMRQNEM